MTLLKARLAASMALRSDMPRRMTYDEDTRILNVMYDNEIISFGALSEYRPEAVEITLKTAYLVTENQVFNVHGVWNRSFKNERQENEKTFKRGTPRQFIKQQRCRPSHLCSRDPIPMTERRPWLKDPDRPVNTDRKGTLGHYSPQFDGKAAPAT